MVGLFPHIPKATTLQFIGELLVIAQVPHETITEFFELLNTCCTPKFCQFNNKFYEFPDEVGILIGSPLDSLIFEAFMNKFEQALFSSAHSLLG